MLNERQFQEQVVALARLLGWTRIYHTFDSRRSASGFPDLVLVRPPRLVFAELKTDKGLCSNDQVAWVRALEDCDIEVYVWRPRDWDRIATTLRRGPA